MKPTQEQIEQHFARLGQINTLIGECTDFMPWHVENIHMYKVHGMFARLPKRMEDINNACQKILLRGEKE